MKPQTFQNSILVLFYFLLLATPLYFRFITTELFEFNKMILVYAGTVLITGTWIARMIVEKRWVFKRTFLDFPLLLFVTIQLLASLLSMHPRTSFLGYYSRFHGGFMSTLSYTLLYYAFVSNITKKQILPLFGALFTSLSLVSIWGIFEHFGHSLSCSILTGEFNTACWVQDVQNRVYASFGQPNWMAAFIVLVLPLVLIQSFSHKKVLLEKILYRTTLVLAIAALSFTRSRSGFIAFVAELLIMYGYTIVSILKKSEEDLKKWSPIVITTVFIGITTLITGTIYTPSLSQLLQPAVTAPVETTAPATDRLEVGGTDSGEIRKIVWQGALAIWKRYPILGSGVETFAYSYYKDRPQEHNLVSEWDFLYNKAHNEFLNYLSTSGIAGLGSYLFLLGTVFYFIAKTVLGTTKVSEKQKLVLLALGTGVGALSISNFFGFSTVAVSLTMFVFFGACAVILMPKEKGTKATTSELIGSQYTFLTITAIATLFLLTKVYTYWSADVHYSTAKTLLKSGNYQTGVAEMEEALQKSPNEALFYDTFSGELSRLAVALAEQNEATTAARVAQTAITMSDTALNLNPVHLNFYKTRARIFITLAQLEPQLLLEAKNTLLAGIERAPNDPKLFYNLAVVETTMGNTDEGRTLLEETITLKPNYLAARIQLGEAYINSAELEKAREQFKYILKNIDPQNQTALEKLEQLAAAEQ